MVLFHDLPAQLPILSKAAPLLYEPSDRGWTPGAKRRRVKALVGKRPVHDSVKKEVKVQIKNPQVYSLPRTIPCCQKHSIASCAAESSARSEPRHNDREWLGTLIGSDTGLQPGASCSLISSESPSVGGGALATGSRACCRSRGTTGGLSRWGSAPWQRTDTRTCHGTATPRPRCLRTVPCSIAGP